jgi:hypothetical protein
MCLPCGKVGRRLARDVETLHMYLQIVDKLRLALAPMEPEWARVPLYVTACGPSTSLIRIRTASSTSTSTSSTTCSRSAR